MFFLKGNRHISKKPAYPVILLIITSIHSFCQETRVSGTILDGISGLPVPNATVYINGSSTGTTSDNEGVFSLTGFDVPCELIISHVSYELKRIDLQDTMILDDLRLNLERRIVMLDEVTVIHENERDLYLKRFKFWFLGREYEKYRADILNDSVLRFVNLEDDNFSVNASEPLEVYLPATGYMLEVDLLKFDLIYKENLGGYHCSILGYYYFKPIIQDARRKQRIIARNRVEHYYNSIMHFCRSLYHNSLAGNGYLLEKKCTADELDALGSPREKNFTASYSPDQFGNEHLLLTQFACRSYIIEFYHKIPNRPVDLTEEHARQTRVTMSGLTFLKDTVRIYPSGRMPDNSLLFRGSMSMKGITSMLPEDYIPSMR